MRTILYHDFQILRNWMFLFIVILFFLFDPHSYDFLGLVFTMSMSQALEKNQNHFLMYSFPVSRTKMVVARYLFHMSLPLLYLTLFSFLEMILFDKTILIQNRIIDLLSIYIWVLAYLPLYFRFNAKKAFWTMFWIPWLFVMLACMYAVLTELTGNHFPISLDIPWINRTDPLWILARNAFLTITVGTVISLWISIQLYKKRSFDL
jgi:hypothetical protein